MFHPTDKELVERARVQSDKQAFGLLLERHQAGALRMAQRMIAHQDTAREVVQEAMLEAYLSLASLEKPERFQSWLYGIVLNLCRNYLRRDHREALSIDAVMGGLEATPLLLISDVPDPQHMVEMQELHELVLAALDSLSPQNQEAILLYYYEQMSLREISLALGISMTAVKGRLHKSRRRLAGYFSALAGLEIWFPPSPSETADAVQETDVEIKEAERKEEMTEEMIEVKVIDVVITDDDKQGHYVVILLDEAGRRLLPIWIGAFEGHYIALQILGNVPMRPLSYDFMAKLLNATGAMLEEVQISSLQDITFYATAFLRSGETVHQIDARPSDGIALALRMQSKISVSEEVMAKAGKEIPEQYEHKVPRKGLEKLAAQMEAAHQAHIAALEKFKTGRPKENDEAKEELFAYIFG